MIATVTRDRSGRDLREGGKPETFGMLLKFRLACPVNYRGYL